jgi:flagellar motor switch protein FliN
MVLDDEEKTTDVELEELSSEASPDTDAAAEGDPGQSKTDAMVDDVLTNGNNSQNLGAVYNVPVQISAVLGQATLPVNQLLKLGRGAVVELDRRVGEAIDIYVNNRLVARGEVVVVEDRLGITMTEIIKSE